MWQLAVVQGPNITIYGADGNMQRHNAGEFQKALGMMLQQGWEPFGAGDSNLVVVWFRKKVG
jgi:hypothetical protein